MLSNGIGTILEHKLFVIVRGVHLRNILPLGQALYNGGVRIMEVTVDHMAGEDAGAEELSRALRILRDELGDKMLLGAGTVLTPAQASAAVRAGARFIVSPNTDPAVIRRTKQLGAVSIPGALTPTEIADAHRLGADFVKLFPANSFPAGYFKAIRAPLRHIPMIAVGGVDAGNAPGYLRAGMVGVGVGSGIVKQDLIDEGRFEDITALARRFTDALR